MSSQLFDSIERTDTNPRYDAEPVSAYLNRSASPEEARIRELIEGWMCHYPGMDTADILSRLRSKDDSQFLSAFFELYVFTLLRCLGYGIQVHPDLPMADGRRPDFLVRKANTQDFIVEVVWVTDKSEEAMAAEKRANVVYESINKLECADFFLAIRIEGAPGTPPPGRRLRDQLSRWLHTLDYEQVSEQFEVGGFERVPKHAFCHDGWNITFFPIPKSAEHRGSPTIRPLGMYMHEARWVDSKTPIREAVVGKGKRYGELHKPYVIAVNADVFHLDDDDVVQALFGTRSIVIPDHRNPALKPYERRNPDGAWTALSGARHKRVSAVLMADSITPWNVASHDLRLFHNPWAKLPCTDVLSALPQATLKGNLISFDSGLHPREVFGLPEHWPQD